MRWHDIAEAPGRVLVKGRKLFIDGNEIGEITGYRSRTGRGGGYFLHTPFGQLYRSDDGSGNFAYAADLIKMARGAPDDVLNSIARLRGE